MILADTLRLLITITVCCCITGLLMWLFLLYNKKASIEVLLLCSSLLLIRFLYPYEFPFTHSVYITKGYPTLNDFFNKTLSIGRIEFPVAALLLGIWIAGSLWNGFRFLRHYIVLQKSISRLPVCSDDNIRSQLDQILKEKHFSRCAFSLKEDTDMESPFVTGHRRSGTVPVRERMVLYIVPRDCTLQTWRHLVQAAYRDTPRSFLVESAFLFIPPENICLYRAVRRSACHRRSECCRKAGLSGMSVKGCPPKPA